MMFCSKRLLLAIHSTCLWTGNP